MTEYRVNINKNVNANSMLAIQNRAATQMNQKNMLTSAINRKVVDILKAMENMTVDSALEFMAVFNQSLIKSGIYPAGYLVASKQEIIITVGFQVTGIKAFVENEIIEISLEVPHFNSN